MEKSFTVFELMQTDYALKEAYLNIILLDGTVYAEAEEVEHILEELFPNRRYVYQFYDASKSDSENASDACGGFCMAFNYWVNRNRTDFLQYHKAITKVYDPVENYNRIEDAETNTETHFGHKETRDNSATTTPTGSTKNAEFIYGFDSANPSPRGYNETTFDNAKTDVTGHDSFVVSDIDENTFDNSKNTVHSNIHGNIGVTTSATMVDEEVRLRLRDFLVLMLTKFVSEYTYMCEVV